MSIFLVLKDSKKIGKSIEIFINNGRRKEQKAMKKYSKKMGIILLCLIIIWIIFVTIDCIRLGDLLNGNGKKEPLVTVGTRKYQDEYGNGIKYIGLGYLVDYYQPNNSMGYKTTVNLFYAIPIRGYEVQ